MTMPTTHTSHTLDVPGAHLHYEIRGSGPVPAVIGSPMAAGEFAPLAECAVSYAAAACLARNRTLGEAP
ncbi:hypothetical protein [Mycobacterium sp.]|uniref:hypothetical protein n=1 Tax=Mycobacterium sp. TaxID=1785 RepID=UPI0039C909F4